MNVATFPIGLTFLFGMDVKGALHIDAILWDYGIATVYDLATVYDFAPVSNTLFFQLFVLLCEFLDFEILIL